MTDDRFREWQRICRLDRAAYDAHRRGRFTLAERLWDRAIRALAEWNAAR